MKSIYHVAIATLGKLAPPDLKTSQMEPLSIVSVVSVAVATIKEKKST